MLLRLRIPILWILGLLLLHSAGCTPRNQGQARPRIVATTSMLTDLVRQVAGDDYEVVGLMGEGVDPHLYRPTRDDLKLLNEADVVFYNGLLLEGKMGTAFERAATGGRPVFAVAEALDPSWLRQPPEFAGHYDPHVWMDVEAWSKCLDFVVESLAKINPAQEAKFRERGGQYRQELTQLHDYVQRVIGSIPEERRILVTAHDAFGYFGRKYGIEVKSAQGVSTESEPGVDDINQLVDLLVDKKLPALFVESSVSDKNLRAVLEGCESRGHKVAPRGPLFSDATGAPGTYEGTFIGMLDHNATLIARSLGGEAPEHGLHGRLQQAIPAVAGGETKSETAASADPSSAAREETVND